MKLKLLLIINFVVFYATYILAMPSATNLLSYGGAKLSYWDLILVLLFIIMLLTGATTLVFGKTFLSNRILSKSAVSDEIWNTEMLKNNASEVFLKIQKALENKNLNVVTDVLSPELYSKLEIDLKALTEKGKITYRQSIDIKVLEVIGCEDYNDNSKDNYTVYFEGTILKYTILESTGEIIDNPRKKESVFSCIYQFKREANKWFLEHIDDSASSWNILKTKNLLESKIL